MNFGQFRDLINSLTVGDDQEVIGLRLRTHPKGVLFADFWQEVSVDVDPDTGDLLLIVRDDPDGRNLKAGGSVTGCAILEAEILGSDLSK